MPGRDIFRSLTQSIKTRHESAGIASSVVAARCTVACAASLRRRCARRHNSPCAGLQMSCQEAHECSQPASSHTSSLASISCAASSSHSSNDSADSRVGENFEHSEYNTGLMGKAMQERTGCKFKVLEIMFDRAEKYDPAAPEM